MPISSKYGKTIPIFCIQFIGIFILLLFFQLHIVAQVNLTNGLVARYSFTGNTNDSSGNGFNGISINGTSYTSDRFGNVNSAAFFDGVDDYIRVVDNGSFSTPLISISLWFKTNSNNLQNLIGKRKFENDNTQSGGAQYQFFINYSPFPGIGSNLVGNNSSCVSVANSSYINSVDPICKDKWYHAVITYDGAFHKIYINGVLKVNASTSFNSFLQCSSDLRFGVWWSGGTIPFSGAMDDIRWYNRPLNFSEVLALYDNYSDPSSSAGPDFTFSQNTCSPRSVQFFASSTGVSNYFWDFGNGVTSIGTPNPTVTYANYGNYTIKLITESLGNCKDSVTKLVPVQLTHSDIILSRDTTICTGTSLRLVTDSGVSFCWKPDSSIVNPNQANTIVTPVTHSVYYFKSQVLGPNLVNNGNFSAGNTGFTSGYTPAFPNTIEGEYWVDNNPALWNGGLNNCVDHTNGFGKMLMVNGTQVDGISVWSQTIPVTPNTNYAFSLWLQSLFPANPANLSFSINGRVVGNSMSAVNTPCIWKQFFLTWNAGNTTTATISVVNKNTVASGNDFALDDISFAEVKMRYDSLKVDVSSPPNIISIKDTSICKGDSLQLSAIGGYTYFWSPGAGLSDTTISNPMAIPNTTTSYIVNGYLQPGCIGRDTVKVTVLSPPLIGLINDTTICEGTPLQLFASGGIDYKWTPATGLSSSVIFNPTVKALADIVYYLTVTDTSGCSSKDSVAINVETKPVVQSIRDTSICSGSSILLTTFISGATSFIWSPTAGLTNPNSSSPQATLQDTTVYIITAFNKGCTSADTVLMNVLPKPMIDLSDDTTLCKGQMVQILSNGIGSYSWSPAYNITSTSSSNPFVFPDTTTKYFVSVTGPNGCSNQDSFSVTISPSPFVRSIGDTSVCTNGKIVLSTSTNGSNIKWSPVTGLSDSSAISPFANPSDSITYIVTAQNTSGCEAKDTVHVAVLLPPVITVSDDTTTCNKSNFQLFASGGVKYVWSPSSGLSDTTINNPMAVLDSSITYKVIVYGVNGCTMEDSVKIKIGTGRSFTLDPAFPQICETKPVTLSAAGGDLYNWFFGENIVSPLSSVTTVLPTKSGMYKVQITDTVCQLVDTMTTSVVVNSLPAIAIRKSNDIDCFNREVKLSAGAGLTYVWSPASGLSNSALGNPVVSPITTTTYYVTVTDRNGCSNSDSIKVFVNYNVNQNSYQVPNAFTPNGDGKNDCFGIVSWGPVDQLQLSVYNRWGERVFYTTTSAECWDGTYKSVPQSSGAFVYVIAGKTKCGGFLNKKGTVLLIR